jgi:dTDP-glucose 4,6-dehydratase
MAAETHVDNSIADSKDFLHSNINGVQNLLELILQQHNTLPILLQFSTDEIYGDIDKGSHTETNILRPSNPYSATKAAADMLILAWSRTFDIPYVIVRPTNNYGIGQYIEKLIPRTCKYLQLGKKIPLHNNGMPKRVWLHAQDTADAIVTIINHNVKNEIYNISGNCEYKNWEIVAKIAKLLGDTTEYYNNCSCLVTDKIKLHQETNMTAICDFTYSRCGQDVRYSLDDSKLRKLGWSNKCKLDNELPSVVEYYRSNFIW